MTDTSLQVSLSAFMIVTTWLIVFWKQSRAGVDLIEKLPDSNKLYEYRRFKKVSGFFWLIFTAFGIMTIVYTLIPDYYYLFFPLDIFHHPIINTIGILILTIGVVWIVIAQIQIDIELFKYSRNIEKLTTLELVRYSERMLLFGMLVFFIGYFTTITNVIGFLLVLTGIFLYLKLPVPGQKDIRNQMNRFN